MIHRVIVDALFSFFSPRVKWKVWINLCILHHFDSETSHSFRSNFSQLICDKACLTLPRTFPFLFQNRFEIFRFIRMKCISSYYKRENSMIYRIIWNVFFITRGQLWPSGIVVACVCLCVCVCMCVCVSVNHQFVRTITCHPLKLQSPNLDQKCKTPWLRSLLFLGFIDLDLQGQIELKSQNLPHFGLVRLSGRQVNTKWSEAFQIWTKNAS